MDERVVELLEHFAAARARGERPDPLPYLERAGDDADALRDLIDALLTEAPPPPPDPAVVAMMDALVAGDPPLLGARLHRRLPVDAVVDALVARLALDPGRRAKVKGLYQRLEGGLLDAARLHPRLTAALAEALGIGPRDVALGGAADAPGAGPLFARAAAPPARLDEAWPDAPTSPAVPDEIDRLFGLG